MLTPGVWQHQFNRVPVQLYVFADGLRVVHAPETMRELLGARVTSIEGRSADELRTAFGKYFGGREGKRDEALAGELLRAYLLGPRKDLVTAFLDATGVRHEDGQVGDDAQPDADKVPAAVHA